MCNIKRRALKLSLFYLDKEITVAPRALKLFALAGVRES